MAVRSKIWLLFTSIAMLIAVLVAMTIPVMAQSGEDEQHNPQFIITELYANRFNVTIEEAMHRLSLQGTFPDLQSQIEKNEKDTFGGVWIQHEPEYKIVVAFTQNGAFTIKKYANFIPPDIVPYIEIRTVNKSLESLASDQQVLVSSLRKYGIDVDSYVDVKNNRINVDVLQGDKAKFDFLIDNKEIILTSNIKINEVQGLSKLTTDIYGGLTLREGLLGEDHATSGFSIHNSITGQDGIITAGHAKNIDLYTGAWQLRYQSEANGGAYDVQWHTNSSYSYPATFQWSEDGYTRNVTATKSRAQQYVGDIVSKYGWNTQFTAGELISQVAYGASSYDSPTYMLVDNIFDYPKIGDTGDSGGPVFNLNTALGISHAVSPDRQYLYYMAINYINGIPGLSIKLSP